MGTHAHSDDANLQHSFPEKAGRFIESTEQFVSAGVNPGGYYKAVWARDASYILKDWFLSGRFKDAMQEILFIWSHQITPVGEKIIYGRGSPEMKYLSQVARPEIQKGFEGALPTTIFHGFSEVYGERPDIDSTALMISTTAWILDAYLKAGMVSLTSSSFRTPATTEELKMSSVVSDFSVVMEFAVPRMLKAIDYLSGRDADGDGLLEQGHNEDWMDTVLRAGKIVYSQACWILALSNLSSLLSELGRKGEAKRLMALAQRTILAVEQELWLEEEGTYIDKQESHHLGDSYKMLTQDVSLYLIAITENTIRDMLSSRFKGKTRAASQEQEQEQKAKPDFGARANRTLDAIKSRIWQDYKLPLVTEAELKKTGPWVLHPNQYHNHTFWPWITGIEMLARSRFGRIDECETLLEMLAHGDDKSHIMAFYEWVNPITGQGQGAYPFRTGVSAIRTAVTDILQQIKNKSDDSDAK